MNKLYYGDNLEVLRDKIPDNYVDLIYLDPPFQSGKNYNIIFDNKRNEAEGVTAQIQAFEGIVGKRLMYKAAGGSNENGNRELGNQ